MLLNYLQAAMRKAHYEMLPDDEGFYGEIPGFQGVWANEKTLEATREELASALEDWDSSVSLRTSLYRKWTEWSSL